MFSRREFLKNSAAAAATIQTAALFGSAVLVAGCNGVSLAQDIVNWTPALESSAATVAASASILLPADAILIAASLAAFNGVANLIKAEAQAYLANPGQSTLQALQTGIITLQQQVSSALLSAVKIVDPNTQKVVTNGLNAVATIVNAIISLITQIKGNTISSTAVALAKTSKLIKLQELPNFEPNVELVAVHYNIPYHAAEQLIFSNQIQLTAEGL